MYHGKTNIVQSDDYYPFGLTFNGYQRTASTVNRFGYNGKEFEEETEWTDFGARRYMADIGRWFNGDPLADKYTSISPYAYVANNPIIFIDPDGRKIRFAKGSGLGFKLKTRFLLLKSSLTSRTARRNIRTIRGKEHVHTFHNAKGTGKNRAIPKGVTKWKDNRPDPPKVEFDAQGNLTYPEGDGTAEQAEWRSKKPTAHIDGTGDGTDIEIDFEKAKKRKKNTEFHTEGTVLDHEVSHSAAAHEGRQVDDDDAEEQRTVEEVDVIREEKNKKRIKKLKKRRHYKN